ncbi:hypothetical protein F66182_416, partial [Fusarium sp. NRRL 66182]
MDSEDTPVNANATESVKAEPGAGAETDEEELKPKNVFLRVMAAFRMAEPRMHPEAAKETKLYLRRSKLNKVYKHPSRHPIYQKIRGHGSVHAPENLYYPNLLIIQAIWPRSIVVKRIAAAFGEYWDDPMIRYGPEHYPRLDDRERELRLFRGQEPHPSTQVMPSDPDYELENAVVDDDNKSSDGQADNGQADDGQADDGQADD